MSGVSDLRLKLAALALRQGKLIAYPTEAVYGLGCDPFNESAIEDLLDLKGRSAAKGLILIASDISQIDPLVEFPSEAIRAQVSASWPGPVTWIIPASSEAPEWLRGKRGSLAIRVSAHPVASALCKAWGGPLISTSANPSGAKPARTALKTRLYFGSRHIQLVPGKVGQLAKPTAIFDARTGRQLR